MKNTIVLTALFSLMVMGCKGEKKTEAVSIDTLQMKEVMAIHDEVMPKMGKVGQLVGQLKPMIDTTAQGKHYEKAVKDLQAANESMMKWMQDFGNRFDSDEIMNGKELTEEKKAFLHIEEKNIKLVKEQIETSIANAEALLKD